MTTASSLQRGGWGIGRYIKDLESVGGQDGVYDAATETLTALRVSSAYFGYERMWKPSFSSTFTFGVVHVDNLNVQPDDALGRTRRATVNFTWHPMPDARLVLEFPGGTRRNKDGATGSSSQIQAGWIFAF